MKTAAALLALTLLFALRRPLFRAYLWARDWVTDAPLTRPEAWVYRRLEGD